MYNETLGLVYTSVSAKIYEAHSIDPIIVYIHE